MVKNCDDGREGIDVRPGFAAGEPREVWFERVTAVYEPRVVDWIRRVLDAYPPQDLSCISQEAGLPPVWFTISTAPPDPHGVGAAMKSPPKERTDVPAINRFLGFCHERMVEPRTMLIRAAEISSTLYYLLEGSVEVIIEDERGKEMVLAYLNPGHFFGEMGFFRDRSVRSAWVRARTQCRIAEMNYSGFRDLAGKQPELVFEMATQLAVRLARTSSKVGDLAFLDVTGRVAHALLDLSQEPDARPAPGGRLVAVTRPQLARLVGCSREMVSKVLKILHAQGLIRDGGDGILVREDKKARTAGEGGS